MPKVKKIRSAALTARTVRHAPLGQVLVEDEHRQKYAVVRQNQPKPSSSTTTTKTTTPSRHDSENEDEDLLLDEKTTQKILQLSREQQMEIQQEEIKQGRHGSNQSQRNKNMNKRNMNNDDDDDDDDDDEEENDDDDNDMIVHDNGYVSVQDGALSAEDEAIVEKMIKSSSSSMTSNNHHRPQTLADIIMAKIAEQEEEEKEHAARRRRQQGGMASEDDAMMTQPPELPPKVVQVYTDIGQILSRYTSGKLPKAFKVIPSLSNWEDVLYLTRPDVWSPMAMYAATKIFASNLNPKMAQRFYHIVLLDAVRADIVRHHKLNYHYYMALKKSVYKPAAFFKGILLPLCQDERCTLREAAIVASVLTKVSIPVHHAAVAIHKLAATTTTSSSSGTIMIQPSTTNSGVRSLFLRAMLQKKYSLPTPVLKQLVQYFVSFLHVVDERQLPLTVLWHQSLLVFLQRYKGELLQDYREDLKRLMKQHFHAKITPECRRELFGAQAYKEERMEVN